MKARELMQDLGARVRFGGRMDYRAPRKDGEGPTKWCHNCSRRHPARKPCDLYLRTVTVDHGNRTGRRKGRQARTMKVWSH